MINRTFQFAVNISTFPGCPAADTPNRGTGPSTSAVGGAVGARRAPATSRELLRHRGGERLSDVGTAGNTEPRAEETQADTLSDFHDNCNGVFAGLGAPGCAGTRSLGTEQEQPLLRSRPERCPVAPHPEPARGSPAPHSPCPRRPHTGLPHRGGGGTDPGEHRRALLPTPQHPKEPLPVIAHHGTCPVRRGEGPGVP